MSDQSVTVNWLNNCVVNQQNQIHLQRSSRLGFFHPHANVVKIDNEHTRQIDLTKSTCMYIDHDIRADSYYSYRVIVNTPNGRASSVPTSPVFVPDLHNDIGYVNGDPASTFNYNIASEPIFHVDANRLYNTCAETNDKIEHARTMLRHNTGIIDNVIVTGDPIFDSRDTKTGTRYICGKTDIPYNQSNITEDIPGTDISLSLAKDISFDSGAVMFATLYTEYTSADVCIQFKPCSNVTVIWSHDTVVLKTTSGKKSLRRKNTTSWVVFTIRYTDKKIQLWENGVYVGHVVIDSKMKFKYTKQSSIYLLGKNKSNCGFSELMFFDEPQHVSTIDIVNHYMCNKYDVDPLAILPKDL